ncbi:hypothetical protein AB9E19_13335 [Rhizobium leguminosarum]|uniref:hypothetical protein n=1 Tax=Rhizobium leguminosarum TaxID=384 RepID=UPI003F96A0D0
MSADIMPRPSPSTRFDRSSSKAARAGTRLLAPPDDPALIVGLVLAFARTGRGDAKAIPPVLLKKLNEQARQGDLACRLVLDWLTKRTSARYGIAGSGDDHAAAPDALLAEILSAHASTKEDR